MLVKIVMLLVVGSMLVVMARLIAMQIEAAKARAKVVARKSRGVTSLRRDPVTGVYYPER